METDKQADIPLHGHFLIVDDRRDIRFLARLFIEQAGCNAFLTKTIDRRAVLAVLHRYLNRD